jgi:hypothetical protein
MNPLRKYSVTELIKELQDRSIWVLTVTKAQADYQKGEPLNEQEWEELKRDFDYLYDNENADCLQNQINDLISTK